MISGANDTIFVSSGGDTVFATDGASQVFAGANGITYVAGAAPVVGTVYTGASAATVYGGSGTSVQLIGASRGSVIVAGDGNETLLGARLTGGGTFFAGGGDDKISGGGGNAAFVAGAGNATIIGGAGANLFAFVNGHAGGANLLGFNSSDVIALTGYAPDAAQALLSQTRGGGAVSFTLSDNTHVTLTGVSSLSASNFA